ncbi:MAG: 50S ribosomal protein L21 [Nitrospinae bacterium]|nr:50S ribosomal protein L21 [Nitrospinota bacterium]
MFAVVKTGGKQYRVAQGDIIVVEKIDGDVGATVELSDVLMLSGDAGVQVGKPVVDGKKVSARIVRQDKGEKIVIIKHRRRKDSRLKKGHRQLLTTLEIVSIN